MRLVDSRRLTGVSFDLDAPGAVAEVAFDPGDDVDRALLVWWQRLHDATHALALPLRVGGRRLADIAFLAFEAPVDALYVATTINEWAVECAARSLRGDLEQPLDEVLPGFRDALARERIPDLARLRRDADARHLPLLLDDEALSLGAGARSRSWPRAFLPHAEDVPWDSLGTIPIALVTGTNGKTTTARLVARIAKHAGHVPGNTSTDGLAIDEHVIDPGDWTGPGAARIVLRDHRVTLAVLEVARGGILRRGLAVDRCDAACVTNVAPDHLGEYGVDDLATMARVKAVVARVVRPDGRIVLGADSPPLLDLDTAQLPAPVTWFSLDPEHPRLAEHRAAGGDIYFARDGALVRVRAGGPDEPLVAIAELPFCFGGAARHNVSNALAATALATALGLPDAAIVAGLRSFADNPGRAHYLVIDGAGLFLDFAHNPHGIAAVAPLIARLRGHGRLCVSLGVAGDRRDDDIRAIARAIAELRPDLVLTRDLEHYLRGRNPGDVPALLEATFAELGLPCERVDSEVAAVRRGLAWAQAGDLVAILVHVDRDEVWAELRARGVDPPAGSARIAP